MRWRMATKADLIRQQVQIDKLTADLAEVRQLLDSVRGAPVPRQPQSNHRPIARSYRT